MPLPANVTTVTVLGTFLTPEGDPSTGTISFTASSWLTNSGANVAIPNSTVTKTLGTAGNFSVLLPITDDPDISPSGFVYNVSEVVDGVSQNYNVSIPGTIAGGGTLYLADLAPVAPAGPEYYSLASSLTIGTVTTVATGGSATASITGLAPSQVLDLGIPVGATGTVASAGSGSAGTAAVAPTGDTNTGLFFPAADTVAVTTGGTERVRVTSAGRVVVGTTSALAPLHVYNSTDATVWIAGDAATGVVARRASTDASGGYFYFDKTRGSNASNSVVASGDQLGFIAWRGFDGSAYRTTAQIAALVDGDPGASDMPSRLSFETCADGGITRSERMRIDSNGLITGTGTSLGAWTTYTPTLAGTGWAIGNGTASGYYCQIGKVMFIRVSITFGNTSTFGAGGLTCSLPANANGNFPAAVSGIVRYVDSSASAIYAGHGGIASNTFNFQYFNTNGSGQLSAVTSTSAPFTWADTDIIRLTMAYEIA